MGHPVIAILIAHCARKLPGAINCPALGKEGGILVMVHSMVVVRTVAEADNLAEQSLVVMDKFAEEGVLVSVDTAAESGQGLLG